MATEKRIMRRRAGRGGESIRQALKSKIIKLEGPNKKSQLAKLV